VVVRKFSQPRDLCGLLADGAIQPRDLDVVVKQLSARTIKATMQYFDRMLLGLSVELFSR
jgi:hypothetical protein